MKKLLLAILCSVFAFSAWSQNADEIVNTYLKNIGGVEKWKSLKTARLAGTVPTPQGDFAFEMLRKAPNKLLLSIDVMGQKLIPQAYDGEIAWTINPFMGSSTPQKLPEDQYTTIKSEADFEDVFIDYAKKGSTISYEGTEDVDGINCFIVKLIKNKGNAEEELEYTYYFDSETYLPVLVKQTPKGGQMAGQEMSVYYSDYQDAGDGLIMPFKIDTRIGGQSLQAITFSTIELNGEISDDVFTYKGE